MWCALKGRRTRRPFRADEEGLARYPGRCPGLVTFAPMARCIEAVARPPRRTRIWLPVAKKIPASEDAGYSNWNQDLRISAEPDSLWKPEGETIL